MSEEQTTQPPIGIQPEWIWREQRVAALKQAAVRRRQRNLNVPEDWLLELGRHLEFLACRDRANEELSQLFLDLPYNNNK